MSLIIKSIEYYLPEKIVTNEDMQLKHPQWDIEKLGQKSGVFSRHIAGISETAFDLAREALKKMFQSSKIEKSEIDGIVFCTQSPDFIMPGNSFLIHKEFGFDSRVWSFDYNLACSGFIYGLAITRGMIATGLGKNILLINADTYSRFINRDDRSTSILFGDGATVTIISSTDKTGIIDLDLASEGSSYDYFYIPAGGSRLPSDDCLRTMHWQAGFRWESGCHTARSIHAHTLLLQRYLPSGIVLQTVLCDVCRVIYYPRWSKAAEDRIYVCLPEYGRSPFPAVP